MTAAPADPVDSPRAWRRLALALLLATVGNAGMWSVVVVLPAVQAEFGTGRGDAALPYTLTMLGFAAGNLLIGRAVDRWGVARALSAAAVLAALGYLAAAASPSILVLSLAQGAIGLGTAAFFGPLIADVSLWFRRRRGIAVAVAASGNYLAGAIWPLLLAGVLADHGWRAAFVVLAAAVAAVVLPLAPRLSARLPAGSLDAGAQSTAFAPARAPLPPRAMMLVLGLAGIACCVAMSMPQVHIVALCVDLGYGPAVGAEMLSLMLAGGVASRLAFGLLADRLGGVRTVLVGSVLQGLALVLYLPSDGLASLYLVSLVFGLAQGGIVPAYAIIVRETMPAEQAGARVGFVMMATILGMALGGWMSGWIHDVTGSYRAAFLNGIAWNVLNAGILLALLLHARPRTPAPRPA